jgi:hypothetical protein
MLEIDNSSITNLSPSTSLSVPSLKKRIEDKSSNNNLQNQFKRSSKTAHQTLPFTHKEEKHTLPITDSPTSNFSSVTSKLETVINVNRKDFQPIMSSVDAYTLSSSRITFETDQRQAAKRRELYKEIEESVEKQFQDQSDKPTKRLSVSVPSERKPFDIETYIPLPDRPTIQRSSPIKSRHDVDIRQATVKPYERYASATTRSTAVHCLQEAGYFKGKSWLKQVEISKEMVKHHVKRRIRRADDEKNHKPILLPLRANVITTSTKVN